MSEITKNEFIRLLIHDRDLHFRMPIETNNKLMYTIAATVVSLLTGILIKTNFFNEGLDLSPGQEILVVVFGFLLLIGFGLMVRGYYENTQIHNEQRKIIEQTIYDLLTSEGQFNVREFAQNNGKYPLYKANKENCDEWTHLFNLEPDRRPYTKFHDRYVEAGLVILIFSFFLLLIGFIFIR